MTPFVDGAGRPLGVSAVSDALDRLGIEGVCHGVKPIAAGLRCSGRAVTVRFEAVAPGDPAPAADYIDDVPPGSVIVLDNGGRTDCTVWGDILTACAVARGLAGTIVHGCCRDVAAIRALDYPVFACSAYMKSGKGRTRMAARDVPVPFGATLVHPRDWIVADDDGVLAVPHAVADEVQRIAVEVAAAERRIAAAVAAGARLADARQAHGYHAFAWRGRRG